MQDQIDTLNAQVDLLNDEIKEKEEAIADKQAQIDEDMEQLKTRLKLCIWLGMLLRWPFCCMQKILKIWPGRAKSSNRLRAMTRN